MSTLCDPAKIRALADTGDAFYQGAWWILRQQEAAQITGQPRASFMAGKLSMDEARVKVAEDWDSDWAPTPNETGAPQDGRTGRNGTGRPPAETNPAENAI